MRYLFKSELYNDMLESFSKAVPKIVSSLISIVPLFLGYAFLGMSVFYESKRFSNISNSIYCLIAFTNADMILETFADLLPIHYWFTMIYMYSFLFISVAIVANIFTIILEESFMEQKYDDYFKYLSIYAQRNFGLDISLKANDNYEDDDGINMNSDKIVSEMRILDLKYREKIATYEKAIADLSLKQIMSNEEEVWLTYQKKLKKDNINTNLLGEHDTKKGSEMY